MEFDPTGVLLTFFQCTMVQNIHGIGKNLKLNTWEILTHPNVPQALQWFKHHFQKKQNVNYLTLFSHSLTMWEIPKKV